MRGHISNRKFRALLERKINALRRKTEKFEQEIYRDLSEIEFLVGDWSVDQGCRKQEKP